MIVRASLTAGGVVALLVLGNGPARMVVEDPPPPTLDGVVLADSSDAPPTLPPGIVDTATAVPGQHGMRPAPTSTVLSAAEATERAAEPGTVTVVGPPERGERLDGVGVAVDDQDVAQLAEVVTDDGGATMRAVVDPTSLAFSFVVPGSVVPGEDVSAAVDLWRQVRPRLQERPAARVPPPRRVGAVLDPATSMWRTEVDRTSESLLRALDRRGRAVAPDLAGGVLSLVGDQPQVTASGAAHGVAARAVPPGSRRVPVVVSGDLRAIVVRHPGGGGALLVANPGRSQRVTLQVPLDDERVEVFSFRAARGSLSALVL